LAARWADEVLLAAKRDLRLPQLLAKLDRFARVFLDDIGYVQHDRDEMAVPFTFLAERYEARSVAISTNLVFSDWKRIFKDPMTTMAAHRSRRPPFGHHRSDRAAHGGMLPFLTGRLEESYRTGHAGKAISRPPAEYLNELYHDTLISHQPSLLLAKEQFGAEHLVLGSDYPLGGAPLEDSLRFIMDANLTDDEREQILRGNAVRVLGLKIKVRRPRRSQKPTNNQPCLPVDGAAGSCRLRVLLILDCAPLARVPRCRASVLRFARVRGI
jgi:hypothetical protein